MRTDAGRREFLNMTAGLLAAAAASPVQSATETTQLAQAGTPAAKVSLSASVNGHEAKFMDVAGIRTRYYDVGEGEPILLVHGSRPAGTSSANTWAPILSGLGKRFRVLAPDRRGHGMTEEPTGEYTPTAEVAHLVEFLRVMKIDGFHVFGQSTGAFHAARLAMEHTSRIKSMVIVDSATLSPPVGNLAERRGELFQGRPQTVRDAFKFSMQQLSFNKGHVTDEFVDAAAYMASLPNGEKTDAAMRGPAAPRYEEIIKASAAEIRDWMKSGKYQIPTLLCWGKNDPSAILAAGLVLFDLVSDQNPRTRMLIVNKAGHFHYREYPDEFVRNVTNFITAV